MRLALVLTGLTLLSCAQLPPAPAPSTALPTPASQPPPDTSPWFTLARTHEDREIRAASFGTGPRRVLWIGGIHGDEREGSLATAELPAAFLADPTLPERVTMTVVEDLNPDGSAHLRRGNARGVDLNRNFPAANFRASGKNREALSEPEARALFELVTGWQPELVLVAHSWRAAQFVNFDGPARALAERFAELAGFELRESSALAPTPGSFGSWAAERGLAVLTLEYRRGSDPAANWQATRAAILDALGGERGLGETELP